MKSCKLIQIGSAPFKKFGDLQLLDLSDNAIRNLEVNIFEGLGELRALNLTNNGIESISSKILEPLTKLRDLDLSSNSLNQPSGSIFSSLKSLRSLDLSNNIHLPPPSELFDDLNLRSLVLSSSSIVFPDTYTLNLPNLAFLDLSNNPDVFESGFMGNTLSSCVDLIHLKMVNIKLSAIEASSIKLIKQIRILNLSGNQLDRLDQDVFKGNTVMMDLDLSSNRIERLPPVIFQKTVELVVLDMSKNKLNIVQPTLFATLKKLQILDLSNNLIETLSDTVFSRNVALTTLKLNNNRINALKTSTFSTNTEIRGLDLGNNKLKTIDYVVVQNMPRLMSLNLDNNLLTALAKEFFSKKFLYQLNLSCNQIVSLPADTLSLTDELIERIVYLFGNPWSCGCLNNMIKEKSSVKIDRIGFSDGRYVSCIAGSDSTVCENQVSPEDRQAWMAHLDYFPNPCTRK